MIDYYITRLDISQNISLFHFVLCDVKVPGFSIFVAFAVFFKVLVLSGLATLGFTCTDERFGGLRQSD